MIFHFNKLPYICSAKTFIGAANSYGFNHWSYFFAKTYKKNIIIRYCTYRVEIRKRLQNKPYG